MRNFFAGVLIVFTASLASCSSSLLGSSEVESSQIEPPQAEAFSQSVSFAPLESRDEAEISEAILSVASLADRGAFEGIVPLFAEEVVVDYTSLGADVVETHTPESLTTSWAGVLPRFDQTYHNLSDIQVSVDGGQANATADVVADHFLGDSFWQVSGQYEYRFTKLSDQWQITHMTFNLIDEAGDRTLLEQASERSTAS